MDANRILNLSNQFVKLARGAGAGILFVCKDNNMILLVQRSPTVSEPSTWGVPGGNIEAGETPAKAAIRETKEELGSMPQRTWYINTMINKSPIGTFYIFILGISEQEKDIWTSNIRLNKENHRLKWFKLNELPKNLHSAINIIKN
jgi:mutator protein MutT